jgi:hypothetical protein
MLIKFLRFPLRCLLSLSMAMMMAVPEVALTAPAQDSGVSKINLVIVEGEGAINNVRQRTAREPIVQVEDENRKPIAGATVLFILPDSGPSGTFAKGSRTLQVLTNSKGQAVAKGLKLNNISGKFQIQVEASYKGMSANTAINQANAVLSTAAGGTGISGMVASTLAVAASVAAVAVILTVKKDSGSRTPNDYITGRDR